MMRFFSVRKMFGTKRRRPENPEVQGRVGSRKFSAV